MGFRILESVDELDDGLIAIQEKVVAPSGIRREWSYFDLNIGMMSLYGPEDATPLQPITEEMMDYVQKHYLPIAQKTHQRERPKC
jgi:hypothetical protein